MTWWIWALIGTALLLILGGSSGAASGPRFGRGGYGKSPSDLLADRPAEVPEDVWRWRPLAWELAEKISYPMHPDYALAIWWRESLGDPDTPSTPEKGIGQVLPIAVEDVNQNTGYDLQFPPRTDRRAALASMLYDKINWGRVEGTRKQKIRKTIRAHNDGPPPFGSADSADYAGDVMSLREDLR
jgi:hypothetical protein